MYKQYESLLKERQVTSYQVSKDTGISTATLSDWKTGRSTPKTDKLLILSDYFKVPLSYFVDDSRKY